MYAFNLTNNLFKSSCCVRKKKGSFSKMLPQIIFSQYFFGLRFQFMVVLLTTLPVLFRQVTCVNNNRFCDEDEYFRPYIEILKKRGGIPIKSVYSTNFVDLRTSYGVLLCINGPAYWYGELMHRVNVTKKERDTTVFLALPLNMTRIYQHECFTINRPEVIPMEPSYEPVPMGMTLAERERMHKISRYPTEPMTNDTMISGTKVFGVALVGAAGDYRMPTMFMFTEAAYGMNEQGVMVSSSFAIIGKNEFICHDRFTNKTLVLKSPAPSDLFICSHSDSGTPFDQVFMRAHYKSEYNWMMGPSISSSSPPTGAVTPAPPPNATRAKPTGSVKNRIGPILNPVKMGINYHTLTSYPVNDFPTGVIKVPPNVSLTGDPNSYDPNFPHDFPQDFDPTFPKPHETLEMILSDCKAFPDQKAKCTESMTTAGNPCDVLESVLELKTITWGAAEWKLEILTLIEDIFSHACPQISEIGAKAVVRLFSEILIGNTTSKAKDPFWEFIIIELNHCKNETSPMKFIVNSYGLPQQGYPSTSNPTGKGTSRSLPQIKIQVNTQNRAVFYYEEAAEVDYEFNHVIDNMWKMFSAVLGYCNQFYEIKKSSLFPRFYSMFADDFLIPVQDTWTNADKNDIYANVIGEMVTGQGAIWMDTCMEGAYLLSDAEAYRAMRPIGLANKNETNHFITTPRHYRK